MPMDDVRVPERVSTLELFFDLVFVFTITQVSKVVVGVIPAEHGLHSLIA